MGATGGPQRVEAVRTKALPAAEAEHIAGRMGYYRVRKGAARDALAASLAGLRRLGALHRESNSDDAEDD